VCFGKSRFFGTEKLRVFNERTIGQGGKGLNADIYPNRLIGRRQGLEFNFTSDAGEPLVADAVQAASFGIASHRAMNVALDLANLGY